MGFGTYSESAAVGVTHGDSGYGFAGISAGEGTIALAAGAIAVLPLSAGGGFTTEPIDIPLIVKPSDSDASTMLIGVRVPDGATIGIRDRWVSYYEED